MDDLVGSGVDLFQAVCQRDTGRNRRQGGRGAVSAGENNLGENQEPKLLPGCGPQRLFRRSPKTGHSIWKNSARMARMSDDNWKSGHSISMSARSARRTGRALPSPRSAPEWVGVARKTSASGNPRAYFYTNLVGTLIGIRITVGVTAVTV